MHRVINTSVPRAKYENLLLAMLEQYAGVEEVQSYPCVLTLDPSSACGLRCPMCPVSYETPVRSRVMLEWKLFEKLLDEVGPYLLMCDLFSWGEPLLNKHLSQILRKLHSHQVEMRMSSSLSVTMPDEVVNALVESQLDVLTVSIDGMTQKTYETYRVRGNLDLALGNLERLVKAKRALGSNKPFIDWQYLVFAFNEHEIEEARKHAASLGVQFSPTAPYVDLDRFPDWLSSRDEFVMDRYKTPRARPETRLPVVEESSPPVERPSPPIQEPAPPRAAPDRSTPDRSTVEALARQLSDRMAKTVVAPPKTCDWHYLMAAVNANGSISPCCGTQEEELDFGSIADKSFREVWNNENYRKARRFYSSGGYSRLADPKGTVCYECPTPEDQGRSQGFALRTLAQAPQEILERAHQLLPVCWTRHLPRPRRRLKSVLSKRKVVPVGVADGVRNFAIDVGPANDGSILDFTTQPFETRIVEGLHGWENKSMRWLSQKGSVLLRVPDVMDHLFIDGVAPPETARDGLTLAIRAKDAKLGELRITKSGNFRKSVAVAPAVAASLRGQVVAVEVEASRSFSPAELHPGSDDDRRLSVAIKRIGFAAR